MCVHLGTVPKCTREPHAVPVAVFSEPWLWLALGPASLVVPIDKLSIVGGTLLMLV